MKAAGSPLDWRQERSELGGKTQRVDSQNQLLFSDPRDLLGILGSNLTMP